MARRHRTTSGVRGPITEPPLLGHLSPPVSHVPTFDPWTPWSSSPPSGTYDPSLDAARDAASRGYGDLQNDIEKQNQRDTVDYGLGREDIIRQGMQTEADRERDFAREGEDYGRNVEMLKRAYAVKGNQQTEQANAYGVLHGGAVIQAAAKRAANQARDRQPLDTAHSRFQADAAVDQQRRNEGAQTALGRLALMMAPPDAGNPLGGRSFQDRATQLTRAGREDTQFGIDTEAQKGFQAAGTGWDPGTRPKGEYVSPTKGPWHIQDVGGIRYRVDPSGHVLSSKRLRRRR